MLTIGLTGGIGSGKTSVSDLFQNLGVPVIDTDVIARELVDNDPDVLKQVADTFGHEIIKRDGCLDRKKLAQTVFHHKENKQKLEEILHPRIRLQVQHRILELASDTTPPLYAIISIPLLIETNFRDHIDRILVVMADEQARIERVRQRDDRDVDEIEAIISHQVSDEQRQNQADDIITNNGNLEELEYKVKQLHKTYIQLAKSTG